MHFLVQEVSGPESPRLLATPKTQEREKAVTTRRQSAGQQGSEAQPGPSSAGGPGRATPAACRRATPSLPPLALVTKS